MLVLDRFCEYGLKPILVKLKKNFSSEYQILVHSYIISLAKFLFCGHSNLNKHGIVKTESTTDIQVVHQLIAKDLHDERRASNDNTTR